MTAAFLLSFELFKVVGSPPPPPPPPPPVVLPAPKGCRPP